MTTQHDQQVIFITGASKGIGKTIFKFLQNKNYKVYGTSRNGTPIHEFLEKPINPPPLLKLDVTNDQQVTQVINGILNYEKKIDVIINNAGYGLCGALKDTPLTMLQEQMDTNFLGPHRIIQAVLPSMIKRGTGKIINIGSFGGRLALPYQTAYSASKAAIAMYSDGLRMELKQYGIQVSLIEPGDTKTDFNSGRRYVPGFENDTVAKQAITIMHEAEQKGAKPENLAKLVHKIIKAKNPRGRYLFGNDSIIFGFLLRVLPHSFKEYLIMNNYKVPRKPKFRKHD